MCVSVCVRARSVASDWNPMDSSSPGSSVHGIFQVRILGWVAISFSRGSCQLRDQTQVSRISCRDKQIHYHCTTWAKMEKAKYSHTNVWLLCYSLWKHRHFLTRQYILQSCKEWPVALWIVASKWWIVNSKKPSLFYTEWLEYGYESIPLFPTNTQEKCGEVRRQRLSELQDYHWLLLLL